MTTPESKCSSVDEWTPATLEGGTEAARRRHQHTSRDEDGFVLIAVLTALALLAMVALLLTKTVSLDTKIAGYSAQQAIDEALADGITRLALQHLAVNPPAAGKSGMFSLDGIPLTCRIGDGKASIRILDVDGLINLNLAPQALLEWVFAGVGVAQGDATALAQAVVDFRSAGETSISGGSKLAAYRLAGLPYGPKNGAFATVGELDQVPGITPALLRTMKPLLTVHSQFAIVNPKIASLPVLLALAGDPRPVPPVPDPQELDALRASLSLPASFTNIARTRGTPITVSNTYLVRVAAGRGRAVGFVRQVVVSTTTGSQGGSILKEWIAVDPDASDAAGGEDAPPCIGDVLWIDR